MSDRSPELEAAVARFVGDAMAARDSFTRDGTVMQLRPGIEAFAERLAELPSAKEADAIASDVAHANAYLVRNQRAGVERRTAGRGVSAEAVVETGVAGLVLSGEPVDTKTLAAELAAYLAGPTIPVWDYAIVDADVADVGPIPVVDGWELVTPTAEDLAGLIGVPSAARHVGRLTFNLDLYGGLAMLHRVDPEGKPHSGLIIYWNPRPAHALWQPLLALSLFQNPVVHLWAQYDVEPGRRVDVLFDRVYTEPWTPDGVTEIEVVRRGDYEIDESNAPRLRRFLTQLAPLLDRALAQPAKPTKGSRERAARVRRIAEHFLTAGEDAHGEGEVLSELNADAVLHYVIAIEAVLTGDDSDKSELTRKVVQRAAVLAGTNDEDRRFVAALVLDAYRARSSYAHGGDPEDVDLPGLRRVVRDCIVARMVIGDPTPSGETLASLADAALLDHQLLAERVRGPISEFWKAVDGS
ncbi:MAG: hypothetical protein ACLGHT_11900 [Acidimicrobiia bacterium]